MLSLFLFFIIILLLGFGHFLFKYKLETGGSESSFNFSDLKFTEIFKEAGLALSKVYQHFMRKRQMSESERLAEEIQMSLDELEVKEISKNEVSDKIVDTMGLDLRDLRNLSLAEKQFRSKIVSHIKNNRLMYRENGRLKMIIPLEAMTFLHKNLSPLVNNKGEITLSIKEDKCRIMLDDIDDIEFKEYIIENGMGEEIYNNRAERDTALNTAKLFYQRDKKKKEGELSSNESVQTSVQENINSENANNEVVNKEVDIPRESGISEPLNEKRANTEKYEKVLKENAIQDVEKNETNEKLNTKESDELKVSNTENSESKSVKDHSDIDSILFSNKPKTEKTSVIDEQYPHSAVKAMSEALDDDYTTTKAAPKEKASVKAAREQFSAFTNMNEADIENIILGDLEIENSKNEPHQIEEDDIDINSALGAQNDNVNTSEIDEENIQEMYAQMGENEATWGENPDEQTFSFNEFALENGFNNNEIESSVENKEIAEEEDMGEISKVSSNNSNVPRTIELVHNKAFGEVSPDLLQKLNLTKSFSGQFKKAFELKKALAVNIIKTKPILLNDNKQFMFISEYQLAAALCKLFAPDEDKYYKIALDILKKDNRDPNKVKFRNECLDILLSLSKDGFEMFAPNKGLVDKMFFISADNKAYYSFGWKVKPEIFQIAFEGDEISDNVLSYARWLSEPLNDNIRLSNSGSNEAKPLFVTIDNSIFV